MKRKVLTLVLALSMIVGSCQIVGAAPSSDAKSGLNSANAQISSIESKQSALQKEIDSLDSELVNLLVDIDVINDEITEKKAELQKAQADLKVAQEEEEKQYEAMKKRIKFMYENGDNSILTALLSSNSITDVINKVSYFNDIYEYDRNLLTEYQSTKAEVESLVKQVKEDESQLEENKESLKEQQNSLNKTISSKKTQLSDFDSQLSQAKQLAAEYKATIDEQNAVLSQQSNSGTKTSAGASNISSGNKGSSSSSSKKDNGSSSSSSSSSSSTSGSKSGQAVVNYASQFVGNPYVWGGTSLTNGADCSGFVMSVYKHFGVSLPHSSSALRGVGRGVSVTDMQPGDIICYSGHVAIYAGNNTVVHASNKKDGIKYTSPANYKRILAVRRIF
ncbi:Probable endopeptidase cgR_2070 precursor [uncultured Roseburia sp.]|uniref:NlpC/P60 family protein n=1 Tax=Brotonthovivens ammoniilytica TaxID=2981725 RepID=A0ABT2TKT5_9FIRM|nr:C40 family peptidase [Brotonthovivens ammoniilytica]MCU6762810.1 NlpC/P60 family protein [Brotonthovivens ammoniilytica]SCI89736.1 Probable endopeptidase cgR_2070 precursor [uncultured Roseburia sp.]